MPADQRNLPLSMQLDAFATDETPKPHFWTEETPQTPQQSTESLATTPAIASGGPSSFQISYFDLEIRENPDEIGGWDEAKRRGGISIALLLDELRPRVRFFDDHTLSDGAIWLETAPILVTFNGKWFDIPLMENHLGRSLILKEHIDLFALVRDALAKAGKGWKGHGLDAFCQRTLGEGKTGTGEHAPRLAREGRWAELISYCYNDVLLTQKLCNFIRWNGFVLDKDGERLYLDIPQWFRMRNFEDLHGS